MSQIIHSPVRKKNKEVAIKTVKDYQSESVCDIFEKESKERLQFSKKKKCIRILIWDSFIDRSDGRDKRSQSTLPSSPET